MNRFSKFTGKFQIWGTCFAPYQISVMGIGNRAGNSLVHAFFGFVKPFSGALTSNERLVIGVVITGQQICCFSISTCNHQRRDATHVSSHTCSNQFLNGLCGGNQYFATHMTAFFDRCQLIFKMHTTSTCTDHGFHQLESIQDTTKTSFSIGNDGGKVVYVTIV